VEVRLFNAGENAVEAALAVGAPLEVRTAQIVDLLGRPIRPMTAPGGRVSLPLRAWEIATVRLD
jgi:hypothetical protein